MCATSPSSAHPPRRSSVSCVRTWMPSCSAIISSANQGSNGTSLAGRPACLFIMRFPMRKLLKGALRLVLGTAVVFVVLEGLANTALFWYTLLVRPRAPLAEKGHTRYDPDLGWTNIPNVSLKDYYGPGLDLTTNAQGFRGTRPVDVAVPPGMLRIICSGDSMTLGYGVRDDQTWCQRLASLDPRIEAVNMGQGGYGVDQAYLWYRRDGAALEHQLHIF